MKFIKSILISVLCLHGFASTWAMNVCEDFFSPSPISTIFENHVRSNHDKTMPLPGVSIVVPVYRELRNGNLQRFLHSLSSQKTDLSGVEVVFIINNSVASAVSRDTIWQESRETLAYLQTWESNNDPVIGAAIKAGLKIHILDHSSGLDRNIGKIRQLGVTLLFDLAESNPVKYRYQIVHQFDADSVMQKRYLDLLRHSFLWRPYSIGSISSMQFRMEPGSSRYIYQSHVLKRGVYDLEDFEAAMAHEVTEYGTPRIAVKLSALKTLGGFESLEEAEDIDLIDRMKKLGPVFSSWAYPIFTADRARPDGYDAHGRYLDEKSAPQSADNTNDDVFDNEYFLNLLEAMQDAVSPAELAWLKNEMVWSRQQYAGEIFCLKALVNNYIATNYAFTPDFGNEWWGPIFLILEPWFQQEIHQAMARGPLSSRDVETVIERELNIRFLPDDAIEFSQGIADRLFLNAIAKFVRAGNEMPDEFPSLRQYLLFLQSREMLFKTFSLSKSVNTK